MHTTSSARRTDKFPRKNCEILICSVTQHQCYHFIKTISTRRTFRLKTCDSWHSSILVFITHICAPAKTYRSSVIVSLRPFTDIRIMNALALSQNNPLPPPPGSTRLPAIKRGRHPEKMPGCMYVYTIMIDDNKTWCRHDAVMAAISALEFAALCFRLNTGCWFWLADDVSERLRNCQLKCRIMSGVDIDIIIIYRSLSESAPSWTTFSRTRRSFHSGYYRAALKHGLIGWRGRHKTDH